MSAHLGTLVAQIPICAWSEDDHYDYWQRKRKDSAERYAAAHAVQLDEAEERFRRRDRHRSWDYNEAVGFLELWANPPDTVKGYLYWTTCERITRAHAQPWNYDTDYKCLET
jgi:hypothetical protein